MNQRIILSFLLLLFFISPEILAQGRRMAAADDAFNTFQYNIAVTRYKKAYSRTKSRPEKDRISFKMAECYRLMNNTKRAEVTYRRMINSDFARKNPVAYLNYADMLKTNEKYELAAQYYALYVENMPDDPRGINGVESCTKAKEWIDNPTKYSVDNIKKINSKNDDFAATYSDKFYNALIFTCPPI